VQAQGRPRQASKKLRKGGADNSTLRKTTRTSPKDNTLASATCSPGPRPSPPLPRFKTRTIYNSALKLHNTSQAGWDGPAFSVVSTTDINRLPVLCKPTDNYTRCVDSSTTKPVSKHTSPPNCYVAPSIVPATAGDGGVQLGASSSSKPAGPLHTVPTTCQPGHIWGDAGDVTPATPFQQWPAQPPGDAAAPAQQPPTASPQAAAADHSHNEWGDYRQITAQQWAATVSYPVTNLYIKQATMFNI
jgi:hypothetical protein